MDEAPPLIVTVALDAAAFDRLQALRRRHFPPARNLIPAHLTLFHKLPGESAAEVVRTLGALVRRTTPFAFDPQRMGLRFLGRGVAIEMPSRELDALRRTLADGWQDWLTPQDRHGFRPHVTIQNKVDASESRALFDALTASFTPFDASATGLLLWRYLGGPWEAAGHFPFTAETKNQDAEAPREAAADQIPLRHPTS
ncbi:2'-5' RNA ligase family protein [Aureimonas mangrovi]|uniref:2'-5' RNA ligase family protein n=1 Tax=Aureimonas mangrovi TaxID=2758041 RepID=UPI00163DDF56|nr:2'-5' RNA ligase family protein [Aureimonas mangrovi]